MSEADSGVKCVLDLRRACSVKPFIDKAIDRGQSGNCAGMKLHPITMICICSKYNKQTSQSLPKPGVEPH